MITDINVWCGHWHNQKFFLDTPRRISQNLKSKGITRALISSADAVFCSDPEPWNKKLLKDVEKYPLFSAVPVFKPTLANWEKTLAGYASYFPFRVVRLLPEYHEYHLTSKKIEPVLHQCSSKNFLILIQMRMEDERSHHPLIKVPSVNIEEIIKTANNFPKLSFVCLSAYFHEALLLCASAKNIYVDISFAERMNTVSALLKEIPAARVLFGSHTPFLYTKAALFKMEYAEIRKEEEKLILFKNAAGLLDIPISDSHRTGLQLKGCNSPKSRTRLVIKNSIAGRRIK